MIEKIWRSIDPEFFTVVEDLLEDTLQSVAPSFIVNRITKFYFMLLINSILYYYRQMLKYPILILVFKHLVFKCKQHKKRQKIKINQLHHILENTLNLLY
jgi:hypothetical protein